ncbi:ubiquitin-like protein 5 [Obelidium mucronatum]|nr:ubiquitin-like protein 5 [Obelidium mucronatum]
MQVSVLSAVSPFLCRHLPSHGIHLIRLVLNSKLTKRSFLSGDDTVGDLKKLIAAQIGTKADKIILKKWYNVFKDHITLEDYEIHDGMSLELYYS